MELTENRYFMYKYETIIFLKPSVWRNVYVRDKNMVKSKFKEMEKFGFNVQETGYIFQGFENYRGLCSQCHRAL